MPRLFFSEKHKITKRHPMPVPCTQPCYDIQKCGAALITLKPLRTKKYLQACYYSRDSNFSCNFAFVVAPTNLSTTSPFLMNSIVGMLRMPNSMAMSSFSSTSHLPTTILPSYSLASSSTIGAMARQGPHHVAQKSTTKGSAPFFRLSKFSVVIFPSFFCNLLC